MSEIVHLMAGNGLTVCGINPMTLYCVTVGMWAIDGYGEALPVVTCEKCRKMPRTAFPQPATETTETPGETWRDRPPLL